MATVFGQMGFENIEHFDHFEIGTGQRFVLGNAFLFIWHDGMDVFIRICIFFTYIPLFFIVRDFVFDMIEEMGEGL
jgi:hypothetical protein